MALMFSHLLLKFYLILTLFILHQQDLLPSVFDAIFSVTIVRTVPLILAPTVTYLLQDILPPLVFNTNVVSATTRDIVIDSALTTSVELAIPLGMCLMTVQLNIFLPHSHP